MVTARSERSLNDVTLLTSAPCDLQAVLAACSRVDSELEVHGRDATYEVTRTVDKDPALGAVLRIEMGSFVGNDAEIGRLVPGAARPGGPVWWADAQADYLGVLITHELVAALGGTYFVQDGRFVNREEDPASWMGRFARVRGVDFHAKYAAGVRAVTLTLPGAGPKPSAEATMNFPDKRWHWDVPWSEVERIYDVEAWGLDPDDRPVQVGNVGFGIAAIGGYDGIPDPYEHVASGRSEHLVHDSHMGFTYGKVRFEELHNIRRIEREHDLAVFSDPRSLGQWVASEGIPAPTPPTRRPRKRR